MTPFVLRSFDKNPHSRQSSPSLPFPEGRLQRAGAGHACGKCVGAISGCEVAGVSARGYDTTGNRAGRFAAGTRPPLQQSAVQGHSDCLTSTRARYRSFAPSPVTIHARGGARWSSWRRSTPAHVRRWPKRFPGEAPLGDAFRALGRSYSALVPIIAAALGEAIRRKWLDRLFDAIQKDDPPYIESLGEHWGELCVTRGIASYWADALMPGLKRVTAERKRGVFAWFKGTGVCYSALFKAGRHDELLELLALDPHPIWPYLIWGGRVFAARGQVDEAIAYMDTRAGINTPLGAMACFAEEILLQAGRRTDAYDG
jgi:hypothetical protein